MPAGTSTWILLGLGIVAGSCLLAFILSPYIAWKKGYSPYYWMFAWGPIGLIVISCLPSLKSAVTPESYLLLEKRANLLGGILSAEAIFVGLAFVAMMLLAG